MPDDIADIIVYLVVLSSCSQPMIHGPLGIIEVREKNLGMRRK